MLLTETRNENYFKHLINAVSRLEQHDHPNNFKMYVDNEHVRSRLKSDGTYQYHAPRVESYAINWNHKDMKAHVPSEGTTIAPDYAPISSKLEFFHPKTNRLFVYNPHTERHEIHHVDEKTKNNINKTTIDNYNDYPGLQSKKAFKPGIYTHDTKKGYEVDNPALLIKHRELVKQLWKDGYKNFTNEHEHAIQSYMGPRSFSKAINSNLLHLDKLQGAGGDRSHTHLDLNSIADNLSDHIKKNGVPLHNPLNVYSGVGEHWDVGHELGTKGTLHSPAFISTSLDPRHASEIAPKDILHFKLPAGFKKGIYTEPHGDDMEEHEFLLDKGQKWRHVRSKPYKKDDFIPRTIHTVEPIED